MFTGLERPSSQVSFLDQFFKDSSFRGSVASDDGDVEDNSSKSNVSDISMVIVPHKNICSMIAALLC